MGLIWLRHPVLWHSSRVAGGYNYNAMTAEERKLLVARWHNWYTADWDYAQTTVIFFCTAIFVAAVLNKLAWLHGRNLMHVARNRPGFGDKLTAAMRYATARQFYLGLTRWYTPPLAAVVGVCGMSIFILALMFSARPFYWPNEQMGHSPPLATRSGWIAIAIMPFMIAFATKINFIGLVTETSHEKLQVFHRWSALFMYIASLVHTFPFIINNVALGIMESQYAKSPWYWSGIAALIPQTYLILMSWGIFRNQYYETFKKLHFIASGIFMAALFIHVNFRLTSWDYFWATLALYGLAWLTRVVRTLYTTGFGLPSTIESVGPNLVKISIPIQGRFSWAAGQHVFIRVLGLGVHALTSHPFTISSIAEKDKVVELVLRARGGLTQALQQRVAGKASWSSRIVLDGPYGGLHAPLPLERYERVVFLSGGTGTTFTLPIFRDLLPKLTEESVLKRISFVVAVPDADNYAWMGPHLAAATASHGDTVDIRVHFTRSGDADIPSKDDESDIHNANPEGVAYGRPILGDIIREAHASASRVAIVACGPDGFLYDVRNSVAGCELDIADGFGVCRDLFLHTETYSW